ncbi:hypothetical protein MJO48_16300 [Dickeya fangzhongdai]|uniref:hypothetical protein n=1 Tax=Dickeya fangzhongdai TaxID=1778540 RepID=UPI001EFA833F|nr:hypothetical protein [Dickeya fangzhongdai]ULR30028.1 hypothetical protein MJO48_16300 [Dickeya fangzhongdai]
MPQHILIKSAIKKPFNETPQMPKNVVYDIHKGYWVKSQEKLVSYNSEYGVRVTKKCDIETGEDQKGE